MVELRARLYKDHEDLARALIGLNKNAEVVCALLEMQKLTDQPKELVHVAKVLGWRANSVGKDKTNLTPEEQAERARIADLAVEALRQAVARGLKDLAEVSRLPAFAAVRARPSFQQLVQEQKKEK
jgi:hypothetical protein